VREAAGDPECRGLVKGSRPTAPVFVLHAAVHEHNPKVIAMCHAHTLYGAAFCSMGRPIDPISQDACAFYEDQVAIGKNASAVAVEEQSGVHVATASP
jgi:ribulose-5-phosphate 4-epimerase/fuculose-1-phosphate aldolase